MLAEDEHLAVGFVVQAIEVMLAIRAGRFEEAEQLARECFERGAKAGDVDAAARYGAQLVVLGNAEAAASAYELLRPFADLPMMASLAVACFGSAQHALGVAALTMGDTDLAVVHLREAVHRNLALGHWPAVLSARLRCAEALARRGHPGDESEAHEQRARAAEVAAMLGLSAEARPATPAAAAHPASCTRHGRKWRIEVGARAALVDHSVGILHLAVGRAIRRAVAHIERADAVVGAHLRAGVHTGNYCWYRPV